MRRRVRLGLVLAIAALAALSLRAARAADAGAPQPQQVPCNLPMGLQAPCAIDADCSLYNAVCNVSKMLCQCNAVVDMGTAVASDGGTGGTGGSGGGTGGTGGTGGSTGSAGTPIIGGGMTEAPKSGCSYIPGQR